MGGGVNQAAVSQEQANQNAAQKYAADQQAAAIKAVNDWLAANKSPAQTAQLVPAPTLTSPTTLGGGVVKPKVANAQPGQAPAGVNAGSVSRAGSVLSPQAQAAIAQLMGGQAQRQAM